VHLNLDNFNFGTFGGSGLLGEIENGIYDSVEQIKDGDVVVDIGASTGIVSYMALQNLRKPSQIIMVEPYPPHIEIIKENFKDKKNWTLIERAISNKNGTDQISWNENPTVQSITFKELVSKYRSRDSRFTGLKFIDFLKIDIEGGEYHIFTEENLDYLNNNTGTIVVEFHLSDPDKPRFRNFRDNVLPKITKEYKVKSLDGIDIEWDLPNDHFINYYNCVIMEFSSPSLRPMFYSRRGGPDAKRQVNLPTEKDKEKYN
jgi:FkbM family methyltransferase